MNGPTALRSAPPDVRVGGDEDAPCHAFHRHPLTEIVSRKRYPSVLCILFSLCCVPIVFTQHIDF